MGLRCAGLSSLPLFALPAVFRRQTFAAEVAGSFAARAPGFPVWAPGVARWNQGVFPGAACAAAWIARAFASALALPYNVAAVAFPFHASAVAPPFDVGVSGILSPFSSP
ncbi:hypothetical protein BC567DRAFT_228621 [Phyllosticta citribraziliensis]